MSNLMGSYQTDKSNLIKVSQKEVHLVIGNRKKPTAKKPKYYLLQRHSATRFTYISSLFEWQEMAGNGTTAYSLDYQGEHLVLILRHASNEAEIALMTPIRNSIVSINNMESGAKIDPNADI
jgi:hypothetical protein